MNRIRQLNEALTEIDKELGTAVATAGNLTQQLDDHRAQAILLYKTVLEVRRARHRSKIQDAAIKATDTHNHTRSA